MKKRIAKQLRKRKRKIRNRLDKRTVPEHLGPMLNPGTIHYELSDRNHGVLYGGNEVTKTFDCNRNRQRNLSTVPSNAASHIGW